MSSDALWKSLTTTVGLVVTTRRNPSGVNVMAAEWTYFVAKQPLQVAVVLCEGTLTRDLIRDAGEFSVTLCSAEQAGLADFVGSFSGRDIDKTTSEDLVLHEPDRTGTPWVGGGIAGLECVVRQRVELPGYLMVIGEVVAAHVDEGHRGDPLVKHGRMYSLGPPIARRAVVAAAELVAGETRALRVAASGPTEPEDAPWSVTLVAADGRAWPLGEHECDEYGDLFAEIDLDHIDPVPDPTGYRVLVERRGLKPGRAAVSDRSAALTLARAQP